MGTSLSTWTGSAVSVVKLLKLAGRRAPSHQARCTHHPVLQAANTLALLRVSFCALEQPWTQILSALVQRACLQPVPYSSIWETLISPYNPSVKSCSPCFA